jgi:hypothetical protein
MKRLLLPFLLLGLLVVGAGCSSPGRPMAGLSLELAALERGADGAVTATVRVVNPNLVAYNLLRTTHRVFLDGRAVGTLKYDQPTGVPAQNVAELRGRLELEPGATVNAGTTAYRLESRLVLTLWGDRTEDAKLSAIGTVTVR